MSQLPRPLTQHERSVLDAMLTVVDGPPSLPHGLDDVMVVDDCDCGCPTIYFFDENFGHWPVAEAYTTIERGESLTLFASRDALWGLEWVGSPADLPTGFPDPADLTVWRPPQ